MSTSLGSYGHVVCCNRYPSPRTMFGVPHSVSVKMRFDLRTAEAVGGAAATAPASVTVTQTIYCQATCIGYTTVKGV